MEHSGSEHKQHLPNTTKQTSQKETIEVGNKICPVSGEKINEKWKATYEYKGKIYNFCCPACIKEFKKDPDKYIKIAHNAAHLEIRGEFFTPKVFIRTFG
jgi:YHS domain-containing protein